MAANLEIDICTYKYNIKYKTAFTYISLWILNMYTHQGAHHILLYTFPDRLPPYCSLECFFLPGATSQTLGYCSRTALFVSAIQQRLIVRKGRGEEGRCMVASFHSLLRRVLPVSPTGGIDWRPRKKKQFRQQYGSNQVGMAYTHSHSSLYLKTTFVCASKIMNKTLHVLHLVDIVTCKTLKYVLFSDEIKWQKEFLQKWISCTIKGEISTNQLSNSRGSVPWIASIPFFPSRNIPPWACL